MPRLDYGNVADPVDTSLDYESVAAAPGTFLNYGLITEGLGAVWRAVVAMMRRA